MPDTFGFLTTATNKRHQLAYMNNNGNTTKQEQIYPQECYSFDLSNCSWKCINYEGFKWINTFFGLRTPDMAVHYRLIKALIQQHAKVAVSALPLMTPILLRLYAGTVLSLIAPLILKSDGQGTKRGWLKWPLRHEVMDVVIPRQQQH